MAKIIYQHVLRHHCRAALHLLERQMNNIRFGSVAECDCGQAWLLLAHNPLLRVSIASQNAQGWWIKESRALRRERRDDVDEGVERLIQEVREGRS